MKKIFVIVCAAFMTAGAFAQRSKTIEIPEQYRYVVTLNIKGQEVIETLEIVTIEEVGSSVKITVKTKEGDTATVTIPELYSNIVGLNN